MSYIKLPLQLKISILNKLLIVFIMLFGAVACSNPNKTRIVSETKKENIVTRTVDIPIVRPANDVLRQFISNEIVPFKTTERYPGPMFLVFHHYDDEFYVADIDFADAAECEENYSGIYYQDGLTFLIEETAEAYFTPTDKRQHFTYRFFEPHDICGVYDPNEWFFKINGDSYIQWRGGSDWY